MFNSFRPTVYRLTLVSLLLCCIATTVLAEEFPLRPYYPEVPYITTEDLLAQYDKAIIVDIRSNFEYDVAHINKAVLLPLTAPDFADKLAKLRGKKDAVPMAFYCNGHSCAKSYQAAQLALSLGFRNVFTYDGGIFDWISAAPDKATLMNETPARTERIISSWEFLERQYSYDAFAELAAKENTIVIDIRDPFQREMNPRLPGIRNIPLDPLLDLVTSRIWTEKQLLFFDAVGKQVRWLQYFLESYGYLDYAFLEDGVRSVANDPEKVRPVIEADRSITSDQPMLLKVTADTRLDNSDRKALSYLVANVKFNNYVVVDIATATKQLGMSRSLLLSSIKKLARLKYVTYSVMQNNLIAQADPRLAWKGEQRSKAWKDAMSDFTNKAGE